MVSDLKSDLVVTMYFQKYFANSASAQFFNPFKCTFNISRVFHLTWNHSTRNEVNLVRSSGFDEKTAKQVENYIKKIRECLQLSQIRSILETLNVPMSFAKHCKLLRVCF